MPVRSLFATLVLVSALLVGAGCREEEQADDLKGAVRATPAFTGKVDDKLVGDWTSKDGNSELVLDKSGSAKIVAASYGLQGKASHSIDGNWLADGTDLLLEYSQSGTKVVLKNKSILSGTTLTLIQAGNNLKTEYTKN